MTHDPYLTSTIKAIGTERTVIELQQQAARSWHKAQRLRRTSPISGPQALAHLETATWAYRNARILMGIE